ncbi:hemophore-related protein [Nocardia carnea]|uniref:hemophore-related protein n=1 Tax=Nocardia carnea TaxID=37328 RepID=UPI0024561A2D|nr:hemophore-related protein [Nocardia carnea]
MAHTTNRRFGKFGLTTLTLGAAAAATAFLSPAVASAGPMEMAEPLLTSNCSFAQVDAALHDQAPELAAMLDANPDAKAKLQAKFDQPVEQRRAELQQYIEQNPQAAQQAENDPRAQQMQATLQGVADTCHSY